MNRIENMAILIIGLGITSFLILTVAFITLKPICKLIIALGG